jgi:dienelactone hydrolase
MAERRQRIDDLKTEQDARAYVQQVRNSVRKYFGPFPRRTTLKAEITGKDACSGYMLEKIKFESRPGFLVTGNLYLPEQSRKKLPGVLGLCGHAEEGKSCDLYQSFCQGLVLKGFVVFIIDPISQGERGQFFPGDGGQKPGLCAGHNIMGNQMVLTDDFFGTWRVRDAMRALDYLLSRPEVDPSRIGVTGNSGGGTLTTYLTALDPRLTMAAPSCFVCSYLANMENELPSDAEQNPPGILAAGLDQADLLLCYAPRPTMILSQYDDFFDERYAHGAYEDLRKVHRLLGSVDSAAYFAGPHAHGYYQENREAMYGFFLKHSGVTGKSAEEGVAPVQGERLFVTPEGDTSSEGSKRVFDFTRETARRLAEKRGKMGEAALKKAAGRLLAIPVFSGNPHFRIPHGYGEGNPELNRRQQFVVETEPGIRVVVTTYGPEHPAMHPPAGKVVLYVGHASGEEDVAAVPEVRALTQGKRSLAVVDPRGFGQSRAKTCGSKDFFEPYGSDYLYAAAGEMLGESYLGRRVYDVYRTVDFFLANGASETSLFGRGLGSIIVTFAALLHPSRPGVRIMHYLPGYEILTEHPLACWPLSSLLRGVLAEFDLPDVYKVLGGRLSKIEPWNHLMQPYLKEG